MKVIPITKDWWKHDEPIVEQRVRLMIPKKVSKKYYSVREIADLLGVGIWSIYDYIKEGDLYAISVGRRKRIPEEALTDYLARHGSTAKR